MLPNVSEELGDDSVAGAWQGTDLEENAAAADDGDHAVQNEERLSRGRRRIKHLSDGCHVFIRGRSAVLPELQLHTSSFGVACSVHPGIIDGFGHRAIAEAINEVGRHRELSFDSWRGK